MKTDALRERITLSVLRKVLSEAFNVARLGGERIEVTHYGKVVGAIIGPDDLELLRALEDRVDLERMRTALAESDERVPFEDLRKELGL